MPPCPNTKHADGSQNLGVGIFAAFTFLSVVTKYLGWLGIILG